MPAGLLQLEAGWGYGEFHDSGTEVTFQAFPQALLRWGLNSIFELRLGAPGFAIETEDSSTGSATTDGWIDATLGFKVEIAEERGIVPQTAFLGTLIVPSGDAEFTGDRLDPAFRFLFSNTLSRRLSLGYNVGAVWFTEPDREDARTASSLFDWTVALGITANDRLGFFVESFGLIPIDAETRSLTMVDTGLTYLLTPRLQLDGSVAVGLTSAAPDWTVGLGISFRFPRASENRRSRSHSRSGP